MKKIVYVFMIFLMFSCEIENIEKDIVRKTKIANQESKKPLCLPWYEFGVGDPLSNSICNYLDSDLYAVQGADVLIGIGLHNFNCSTSNGGEDYTLRLKNSSSDNVAKVFPDVLYLDEHGEMAEGVEWSVSTTLPVGDYYFELLGVINNIAIRLSDVRVQNDYLSGNIGFPNGGQYLVSNTTHTIAWDKTKICTENVKIATFENGLLKATQVSSTPNDGSFSFTNTLPNSASYKIRISSIGAETYLESSTNFEVGDNGNLGEINFPNGGEYLARWDYYTITWDNSKLSSSTVKIEAFDNGVLKATPAISTTNDGSLYIYNYFSTGNSYKIRISDTQTGEYLESFENFEIGTVPAPINVVLNDSYPRLGETVTISSIPTGSKAKTYSVRIKYTLSGQVQYQQVHTVVAGWGRTTYVTLWTNPGLAYSNMVLQVVRNGIVTDEYIRGIFP